MLPLYGYLICSQVPILLQIFSTCTNFLSYQNHIVPYISQQPLVTDIQCFCSCLVQCQVPAEPVDLSQVLHNDVQLMYLPATNNNTESLNKPFCNYEVSIV